MNKIKTILMLTKIFAASLILFFTSCDSSKTTIQKAESEANTNEQYQIEMEKQMISDGFHIGEIQHLKNSKCTYIIIDQTTKAKFDPINIEDEEYKSFRDDTKKIYYKFRGLRMMNRCKEAQPIQLTEIKKREG